MNWKRRLAWFLSAAMLMVNGMAVLAEDASGEVSVLPEGGGGDTGNLTLPMSRRLN